jgi:hypothetical protein
MIDNIANTNIVLGYNAIINAERKKHMNIAIVFNRVINILFINYYSPT